MSKIDFYALCRYTDKFGGKDCLRIGYLKKQGYDVPNDLGIKLGVYKRIQKDQYGLKDVIVWHVTDLESGLEVGSGSTKKMAVDSAIKRLSELPPEKIQNARDMTKQQYGEMPHSAGTFMWGKTSRDFYNESLSSQE